MNQWKTVRLAFQNNFPFLVSVLSLGLSFLFLGVCFSLVLPHMDIYQGAQHPFMHPSVNTPINVIPETIHMNPGTSPTSSGVRGLSPPSLWHKLTFMLPKITSASMEVKPTSDTIHYSWTISGFFTCTTDKPGFPIYHWSS